MNNASAEFDLNARHQLITSHFPTAIGVDDFMSRVEVVLSTYGFTGDNTIAMTNLCRDEVTSILKEKIESVFGSSFNTNGLGGVLTCGVTGMKAGLSHSPVGDNGREQYVFFSFPHIAINSQGEVGAISRPGRDKSSCACGALATCLAEVKALGYTDLCQAPGVHDPLEPELSILRQRLARRLRYEKTDLSSLTLDSMTSLAERTITNDLEYLIERCVDHSKADYAVVTGVQIHNWASRLTPNGPPSLEFVAPTKFWVVINNTKTYLDLRRVPSLSPRQLMLLNIEGNDSGGPDSRLMSRGTGTTLQEIPYSYLTRRLGGASVLVHPGSGRAPKDHAHHAHAFQYTREMQAGWQATHGSKFATGRDKAAPTMDSLLLSSLSMSHGALTPALQRGIAAAVAAARASDGLGGAEERGVDGASLGLFPEGEGALVGPGGDVQDLDSSEDDFNPSFLSRVHEKFTKWTSSRS